MQSPPAYLPRARPSETLRAARTLPQAASPNASPAARSQPISTTGQSKPAPAADAHSRPWCAESDFHSAAGRGRQGRNIRLRPRNTEAAAGARAAGKSQRTQPRTPRPDADWGSAWEEPFYRWKLFPGDRVLAFYRRD